MFIQSYLSRVLLLHHSAMILEQSRLAVSPMIPIQECSPLVNKDETKGASPRKSSPGKSVHFREEHNRYFEGGMSAEKEEIWYSKAELGCFTTNYQQAGKVMAICNPNARTWFQILQRSYKNSIKRSLQPIVGAATTIISNNSFPCTNTMTTWLVSKISYSHAFVSMVNAGVRVW